MVSARGDVEAVQELARLLKPGGELIMTMPFGIKDELILGNEARNYTIDSIRKFDHILTPVILEYFEYQQKAALGLSEEYSTVGRRPPPLLQDVQRKAQRLFSRFAVKAVKDDGFSDLPYVDNFLSPSAMLMGGITWRKIPLDQAKALNREHVEGVLCGVWRKN